MQIEDAQKAIIRWIRGGNHPNPGFSNYGYDVYLSNIVRSILHSQGIVDNSRVEQRIRELSPVFYAAAWELCRRGILRPGVRQYGLQATDHGSAGEGYSVTPFGQVWAAESDKSDFVPVEPERFGQMLAPYGERFGPAFQVRAQEAVRCYGAHAYVASCAMCGAAAEAILVAAAIEKVGEAEALKLYPSASGRGRVQTLLLGQAPEHMKREFNSLSVLLKYWRDAASHGRPARITDNEAYTSLALLLRLAQFASDNWDSLTKNAV